jgi:hypothetical protein
MTRPIQPAPKLSGRSQLALLFINTVFIVVALLGVTFAKVTYEAWYQQPLCFEYARVKGVPDIEHLRFKGVVIASGQYPDHHCNFIDTRTNTPVLLYFDEADVPNGLDTLQVCVMIIPVILCGLVASIFWERYRQRHTTAGR